MANIHPFKGLRPVTNKVEKIASPPYDVLNSEEAREMAKENELSFLHVVKPEIDLPESTHIYDDTVYQKGKDNLQKLISEGHMEQDEKPTYYVYKQIMGDFEQVGLVVCASIEDYENDIIKKHEHTRAEKEADRVKHVETLNANTGPVFLTYKARKDIDDMIADFIKDNKPTYDFIADDEVKHIFWTIDDEALVNKITKKFEEIDYLYVADGHHRSASGTIVGQKRRAANPNHSGEEEYNFFLSVIFPHDQLHILDYNRVVKDLHGLSQTEFIQKVEENFTIEEISDNKPYKPGAMHNFGMYLDGKWYKLRAKSHSFDANDPVSSLDVSILQNNLLSPILGIGNPRKDSRIDFVGGIRGLKHLAKRVDKGEAVAFSMYPTTIEQLMAIADAGKVMPPKSTWFEPKLRSGLIVHLLD